MSVRTDKRKAQVRLAKPGEVAVAVRHAAPWTTSSVPRSIRNRPSPRKVKPGKLSPPSPGSPHQEEVVNPVTGKRALGPWSGPFKAHPDVSSVDTGLLPDTLFMDARGAAHLGLDVEEHHKLLRALQEAQEGSGMLSSTARLDNTTAAAKMVGQIMELHRMKTKRMHEMDVSGRATRQKVPSMRAQRAMQRCLHQINQPRRFYSSNLIIKNAMHSKA